MKIGIITYHNSFNYGAALQAYATVKYLESLGHIPYLIDYYPENLRGFGTFRTAYREAGYSTKNPVKRILLTEFRLPSHRKLAKVFNRFAYSTLPLSKRYESHGDLEKDPPEADAYCTGSDQVWNNYYTHEFDGTFFLDFAPKGKPRFALSSSFGKSEFSEEELEYIRKHVSDYDFITVRENTAKNLLAEFGIDAHVVPDPTLLVEPKVWEDFAEDPKIGKPYILVYQLHGDSTVLKKAMQFGKERGLQVVRIDTFLHHFTIGCRNIIVPDPRIFLGLFKKANYVFTDSFHGTVFSLLFGRLLAVELPKKFSDRISTLLKEVGAEGYVLNDLTEWKRESIKMDREKIIENIEKYRERGSEEIKDGIKGL